MNPYYEHYLARKRAEHGDTLDTSALVPAFIPYFLTSQRIRIINRWGVTFTGWVSASDGPTPQFVLLSARNANGSVHTLTHLDLLVGVKVGRSYVTPEPEAPA